MTKNEILTESNKVFVRVLGDSKLVLTEATTAADVAGWDSLNHTMLIAEIEEHFNVKFTLKEVMRFQNVGDMCSVLQAKLGG
jgi:acyl carrier protein